MRQTGLPARRTAHYLLMQITGEGRLVSELIADGALSDLSAEDRARAQRLATEALRGLDRADRMLKPYLKKTPPDHVVNALRLGVIELCGGEAAHGVVNAYVEIVGRNKRTQSMKGLTNAVLRKIAAEGPEGWAKRPVPLTPGWLRQPLVAAWGRDAVVGMEAAHFAGASLDLTVKGDPKTVAKAVGGNVLPTGSVRVTDAGQVSALPGYEAGDWWVQDAAAVIPVKALGDVKGLKVVDLCAAPGGKAMQLAAGGADVTAVDMSERRMARVTQNLSRVGLKARTVVSDAFAFTEKGFDAVLLDAPCSATGTIRRHPDLPYAKDGSEFGMLIDQQARMIDHAVTLLKPGGRLMFCTCSLLPDEGEVQVEEALERHQELEILPIDIPGIDQSWHSDEGGLRLRPDYWPDRGGMDGFYLALLRKPA
ncbi:RsmB/NOP family class I SAM-dependent RNA methyltransferase [Cognatiyoonia sp. IB215182]|uniref:RsmB/NOP family class I SAM-dependent RNA methyltransferase n=1 Tax=Cognatiyoonia sp. IB215182 TaxID=3097353 RepID=UPI002A0D8273|nr:RsmB/NOP family class I SAM-dependent RNA methyltransferase [Cognatiyoonia sp. IB215182]MDX8354567.1 RsmB/NOP family class I SAM-dependent RNA methyltransferase [Cognatiyoonia sp. IB215182]